MTLTEKKIYCFWVLSQILELIEKSKEDKISIGLDDLSEKCKMPPKDLPYIIKELRQYLGKEYIYAVLDPETFATVWICHKPKHKSLIAALAGISRQVGYDGAEV